MYTVHTVQYCLRKIHSLLPLLPCTWTSCGGKTKHTSPPKLLNLGIVSSADWPVGHMIEWLLPVGGGSWPNPLTRVCIYQPKKLTMSKLVYYSFYLRGGWAGWKLILAWIRLFKDYFLLVVFTWRIMSSDRKHLVLFPLNVKQNPNLL